MDTPQRRVELELMPFGSEAPPESSVEDPFATPDNSNPVTRNGSTSAVNLHQLQEQAQRKWFRSRRVRKGEIDKPWLRQKDPREKWVTLIPLIGIAIGTFLAAFLIYDGLQTVISHEYCPVLLEDFSGGLDPKIWTKEAEVGGYG